MWYESTRDQLSPFSIFIVPKIGQEMILSKKDEFILVKVVSYNERYKKIIVKEVGLSNAKEINASPSELLDLESLVSQQMYKKDDRIFEIRRSEDRTELLEAFVTKHLQGIYYVVYPDGQKGKCTKENVFKWNDAFILETLFEREMIAQESEDVDILQQ